MVRLWEADISGWEGSMHEDPTGGSDDDAEIDYDNASKEVALEEFTNMLIDLKASHVLSARTVCVLCFWASKLGVGGLVAEIAMGPNRPSG